MVSGSNCSPVSVHELGLNGSNGINISNGQSSPFSSDTTKVGHLDTPTRKKTKISDVDSNCGSEWVEQDEPGVYITLVSLPGGINDLKRVRFSRKRFSEKEAEQWWATNRDRVYQQYDVPMVDKAGIGVEKDGILH